MSSPFFYVSYLKQYSLLKIMFVIKKYFIKLFFKI